MKFLNLEDLQIESLEDSNNSNPLETAKIDPKLKLLAEKTLEEIEIYFGSHFRTVIEEEKVEFHIEIEEGEGFKDSFILDDMGNGKHRVAYDRLRIYDRTLPTKNYSGFKKSIKNISNGVKIVETNESGDRTNVIIHNLSEGTISVNLRIQDSLKQYKEDLISMLDNTIEHNIENEQKIEELLLSLSYFEANDSQTDTEELEDWLFSELYERTRGNINFDGYIKKTKGQFGTIQSYNLKGWEIEQQYQNRIEAIKMNFIRKMKKGTYDHEKAKIMIKHLIDSIYSDVKKGYIFQNEIKVRKYGLTENEMALINNQIPRTIVKNAKERAISSTLSDIEDDLMMQNVNKAFQKRNVVSKSDGNTMISELDVENWTELNYPNMDSERDIAFKTEGLELPCTCHSGKRVYEKKLPIEYIVLKKWNDRFYVNVRANGTTSGQKGWFKDKKAWLSLEQNNSEFPFNESLKNYLLGVIENYYG